jgi:hypothetical protein
MALAEDRGDHVVLRPVPDDPVTAVVGAFAAQISVLGSEEAERLDREEELSWQEPDAAPARTRSSAEAVSL